MKRTDSMRTILKAAAACALAAGLSAENSRAGNVYQSDFQGSASATITYTTGTYFRHGQLRYSTDETSAGVGVFQVTPISPAGTPFDAYCVALNIQNPKGDPIQIVADDVALNTLTNSSTDSFQYSAYIDVGNRLAFLLEKYDTIADDLTYRGRPVNLSTNERETALSLALWNTIDRNFDYDDLDGSRNSGISTSDVNRLYNALIDFDGYDANVSYADDARLLWNVTADTTRGDKPYQNLAGIIPHPVTPPGPPVDGAVPEPTSVISALIGLGAAGLFAGRRRGRA